MKAIIFFYRLLLQLRYKIELKGIDLLKDNNAKLFLPNHQALVDPQILVTQIFKYTTVCPVATEQYFAIPVVRNIMRYFQAIEVSDLSAGSRDSEVLKNVFANVSQALANGKNVLLYPSGQIAGQGYEKIFNKLSAWAVTKTSPENTTIVGVRIRGLWGSMWSRAWVGKTPNLMFTFVKAFFYLLANLLFFLPRRKVTIEFENITNAAKQEAAKGKAEFNTFLENWYNKEGEEDVFFLKHFFFLPTSKRKLPARIIGSEKDVMTGNSILDVPAAILKRVSEILISEAELKNVEIKLESNLSNDLNVDSLKLVAIITAIETEFKTTLQDEITNIKTVADLCCVAQGIKPVMEDLKPANLTHSNYPNEPLFVDIQKNIVSQFVATFSSKKDETFAYDKLIGTSTRKDFLLKAMVVAQLIKKEVQGKNVGIMLPALQSTTLLVMATYLAGKIPVMLNWTVGKSVLDYCAETAKLDKILTARNFFNKISDVLSENAKAKCIFFEEKVKELTLRTKITGLLHNIFKIYPKIKLDETAVILFTSGSETVPKAVPLTHRNIVSDLHSALQFFKFESDKIFLGFLPPFHSFGFTILTIFPAITGLKIAYTPDPTDSREVVKILKHTEANTLLATPTFLKMIISAANLFDLRSVQLAVTGAESLPQQVIEQFKRKANKQSIILEGYGITECSPVITINPLEKQKLNSVGKFIPNIEGIIVNPETYETLEKGKEGMILVHGENVFNGYADKSIASPFVEINGKKYYKTGDLGYFDDEDFLFISGRMKRFIKIAGEMISLPAIESKLLQKYGMPDFTALAVEGSDTGEKPIIVLFSVNPINIDEANAFLKECGFSGLHKISANKLIPAIPLLGTGKTDYKQLKKMINE